jgi:peptidoglycan/xylan/chitin deacetylase (PgdA/CDA1 family)
MPWKDGYTISDERGLTDRELAWPDGRRAAVSIVVDLSVASGPDGITAQDLKSSRAEFGYSVGLPLVLGALRRRGLLATFAVPALIAEIWPDKIRAILEDGHEVAANGLRHEDVSRLDRDAERERLELATGILHRITGEAPVGFFTLPRQKDPFAAGTISRHTVELLLEAGYAYLGNGLADDIPHYWVSDFAAKRAILTLPYYYHYDDQFFLLFPPQGSGLEHPDALVRNWRAEFDAQYKRGRFFSMTIHPHIIGWANRMHVLEEFLEHVSSFPDLWNPTGADCARHWQVHYPQATHLKLESSIWKDYPGSLS